jgi:hypothetical protein
MAQVPADRHARHRPERPPGPGEGHIGLHTQRLRVEAAGGALVVDASGAGTIATVAVPLTTA